MGWSLGVQRFRTELDRSGDGQGDEKSHHHNLADQEGRLGSCGCQGVQGRDLQEKLHDQDEDV
jgi:hypothetical protein